MNVKLNRINMRVSLEIFIFEVFDFEIFGIATDTELGSRGKRMALRKRKLSGLLTLSCTLSLRNGSKLYV